MSQSAPFAIQRLTPADIPLARGLNALFAAAFGDAQTYLGRPPDDAYLRDNLGSEHIFVLVARRASEVIGGLVAYELDKFESRRREMYIYDLAVAAAHRRKGMATALIDALRDIAARHGAWTIYVQADYGDDPAVALYTKLGQREDVMHFDIPVAAASTG